MGMNVLPLVTDKPVEIKKSRVGVQDFKENYPSFLEEYVEYSPVFFKDRTEGITTCKLVDLETLESPLVLV